jgi:hypothetical protein
MSYTPIVISRLTGQRRVQCLSCDKARTFEPKQDRQARTWARNHAERHGHHVVIDVEWSTSYIPVPKS